MAEEKSGSWFKTIVGTVAGLTSGACLMYVSPIIDKVVKPAKPIANFATDVTGTTVTFHNRSVAGSDGWWDFGDGSPLEPVDSKDDSVTHTYPGPGTYLPKLTWRNLIGEESDRTVSLQIEKIAADPPNIVSLDAIPISAGSYAPATFRVSAKSTNTRLCVWDFGDDRRLEISTDSPNDQDRLVTFNRPGGYMIKLASVAGDQAVEKSTIVYVDEPPSGLATAIIHVHDNATRVKRVEGSVPVSVSFPANIKETTYRFDRQIPARQGFEIVDARLESTSDKNVSGVEIKVAADKRSVRVTGDLKGATQRGAAPSRGIVRVAIAQESRTPVSRQEVPVTATLKVPGTVVLPLPPMPTDWTAPNRRVQFELRDGDRVVWPESQLPYNAAVKLLGKNYRLTATAVGDHVRVEIADAAKSPTAN